LLASSLSRAWGRGPGPGNLTLHWYRWALVDNAATQAAVIHSFTYAALAATLAVTVGTLIAYAVARRLVACAQLLGFIAMAPFVVPGIVLSIGFFAAYSHRPLLLYGSGAMLTVAFTARFLPIAYSCLGAMLQGLSPDLENAARTLGAGQLRTLSRITLPLLRRGLLAGWLLVFIPALRELSSAIFLFTPRTATMTTMIFDLSDAGNFEAVATMGVLILSMTLAVVALAYHFLGRDFLRTESI
jgi:iron(III) transport system permease protein